MSELSLWGGADSGHSWLVTKKGRWRRSIIEVEESNTNFHFADFPISPKMPIRAFFCQNEGALTNDEIFTIFE